MELPEYAAAGALLVIAIVGAYGLLVGDITAGLGRIGDVINP